MLLISSASECRYLSLIDICCRYVHSCYVRWYSHREDAKCHLCDEQSSQLQLKNVSVISENHDELFSFSYSIYL